MSVHIFRRIFKRAGVETWWGKLLRSLGVSPMRIVRDRFQNPIFYSVIKPSEYKKLIFTQLKCSLTQSSLLCSFISRFLIGVTLVFVVGSDVDACSLPIKLNYWFSLHCCTVSTLVVCIFTQIDNFLLPTVDTCGTVLFSLMILINLSSFCSNTWYWNLIIL